MCGAVTTKITAQVGQDILNEGDAVKEGEVIRYTITIENKRKRVLKDIKIKLDVPEGTSYVQPIQKFIFNEGTEYEHIIESGGYVYAEGAYYEEITDLEKLNELTTITIPRLTDSLYTIEYEVRVNKGNDILEISNKSNITYNENKTQNLEFNNVVQSADIRVTMKRAIDESTRLIAGGTMEYMVYIENLTKSSIKDLKMEMISNAFNIEKIRNTEITLSAEDIQDKITIGEIKPNDKTYFNIKGSTDLDIRELQTAINVYDSNGVKYRSNLLKEELIIADTEIDISSPQNEKYVKEGDILEYNIAVKNTGEIKGVIGIMGEIPSILEVQSIYIDGSLKKQKIDANNTDTYYQVISNDILETKMVDVNEKMQLKITARVGYVPESYNGNVISNFVKVSAMSVMESDSDIITHVLKANDEKVENIISGCVWLDKNENEQRDVVEKNLNRVSVKLYDVHSQSYVKNENGDFKKVYTNNKGEYTFTNIKNGSYIVEFEYNTDKVYKIELNDLNTNIFGLNLGIKNTQDNKGERR